DRQAVRVMDFGAVVVAGCVLVFAEEIHRRQRCKAGLADEYAQEEPSLDIDCGIDTGLDDEAVGAGHAPGVEQRKNRELGRTGCRSSEPELDELRKLLARAERRV